MKRAKRKNLSALVDYFRMLYNNEDSDMSMLVNENQRVVD